MNILSEKIIFSKNKNYSKNFLLQAFISASLLFSSKLQNTTDKVFEIFLVLWKVLRKTSGITYNHLSLSM